MKISTPETRADYINSHTFFNMYDFYATPDSEKCLEKTLYYAKYWGLAGFTFSTFEIVFHSKTKLVSSAIGRYGRFTLPFVGMGCLFGASVCTLAQIRKKDDTLNHLFGGLIAGSLWGFKFNQVRVGVWSALHLAVAAAYIKYFKHHDLKIMQTVHPRYKNSYVSPDISIKLYDDPGRPAHY